MVLLHCVTLTNFVSNLTISYEHFSKFLEIFRSSWFQKHHYLIGSLINKLIDF